LRQAAAAKKQENRPLKKNKESVLSIYISPCLALAPLAPNGGRHKFI
jgi:hypothetical protein